MKIVLKKSALLGSILVAFGAASYGMLTTFVELAGKQDYNFIELTFAEYVVGVLGLFLLGLFLSKKNKKSKHITTEKVTAKNIRNLFFAGMSMGFTTLVYYYSVKFISVSIAIVLLMQSVWIGVVLDAVYYKTKPGKQKIIAIILVLIGTVLAANMLFSTLKLDWRGMALGFLAAISYSITIFATNRVAVHASTITRSKWMALGALVLVSVFTVPILWQNFHWEVLYKWGIIFGLFGAFLPPLFLNYGMPKVNLGVGAIVSSLELPVAVCMAYFVLHETVSVYQWVGIVLILIAIITMNLKKIKKKRLNL